MLYQFSYLCDCVLLHFLEYLFLLQLCIYIYMYIFIYLFIVTWWRDKGREHEMGERRILTIYKMSAMK